MASRGKEGLCFFCASPLSWEVANERFSLKQVLHFLNVDWKQIEGGRNGDPPGGGHEEGDKLSVELCIGCSSAAGKFTSLCEELEVIHGLIDRSADKLFNLIVVNRDKAKEPEDDFSKILRKKAKDQCLKLLAVCAKPQVLLKRMGSKCLLFPEEPIVKKEPDLGTTDTEGEDAVDSESDPDNSEEYMETFEPSEDMPCQTTQKSPVVEPNLSEYCLGCGNMINKRGFLSHVTYYCPASRTQKAVGTERKNVVDETTKHCFICDKSFATRRNTRRHRQQTHPEQYFMPCKAPNVSLKRFKDLCARLLNREENLLKPVKVKGRQPTFECIYCSENLGPRKSSVASVHFITGHYDMLKAKLEQLQREDTDSIGTEPTRTNISVQEKKSSSFHGNLSGTEPSVKVKKHKCDHCGDQFILRSSLQSHMRLAHPDKKIVLKNLLRCDAAILKRFPCKICQHPCPTQAGLANHMNAVHPPVEKELPGPVVKETPPPTPTNKKSCPHCNLTFISEIGAAAHIKKRRCLKLKEGNSQISSRKNDAINIEPANENPDEYLDDIPIPVEPHQNEEEDPLAMTSEIDHISVSTKANQQPEVPSESVVFFNCDICGVPFTSQGTLTRHKNTRHLPSPQQQLVQPTSANNPKQINLETATELASTSSDSSLMVTTTTKRPKFYMCTLCRPHRRVTLKHATRHKLSAHLATLFTSHKLPHISTGAFKNHCELAFQEEVESCHRLGTWNSRGGVQCLHCSKSLFGDRQNIRVHLYSTHKQLMTLKVIALQNGDTADEITSAEENLDSEKTCDKCGSVFAKLCGLQVHKKFCNGRPVKKCNLCGKMLKNSSGIMAYSRHKNLFCKFAKKSSVSMGQSEFISVPNASSYDNPQDIQFEDESIADPDHDVVSAGTSDDNRKLYTCTLCHPPRKITTKAAKRHRIVLHVESLFTSHKLVHIPRRDFKVFCDYAFKTEISSFVSRENGSLECHHCHKILQAHQVACHLVSIHEDALAAKVVDFQKDYTVGEINTKLYLMNLSKSKIPADNRRWKCNACGEAFTQPTSLMSHKLNTCTGSSTKKLKGPIGVFKCDLCDKVYRHRPSLALHKTLSHHPSQQKVGSLEENIEEDTINETDNCLVSGDTDNYEDDGTPLLESKVEVEISEGQPEHFGNYMEIENGGDEFKDDVKMEEKILPSHDFI